MSSTIVSPKQLGSGTPSSSNFLRGDGTWAAGAGGTYTAGSGLTLTGSVFSVNEGYRYVTFTKQRDGHYYSYRGRGIQHFRVDLGYDSTSNSWKPISESPNWGQWRALLEPYRGNFYHRHHIYLHDSGKGYTHGCTEVGYHQGQVLLRELLNYRKNNSFIFFVVNYIERSTHGRSEDPLWTSPEFPTRRIIHGRLVQ